MSYKITIIEHAGGAITMKVNGQTHEFDGSAGIALQLAKHMLELETVKKYVHAKARALICMTPQEFSRIGVTDIRNAGKDISEFILEDRMKDG